MKYIFLLVTIAGLAHAFNPPPFLGGPNKPVTDPNHTTEQEKANIEALVRSFNNLSEDNKRKLAEFRKEFRRLSEQLNDYYETLPDELKTLLKQERRIRMSLSPAGLKELDNYTNPNPTTKP